MSTVENSIFPSSLEERLKEIRKHGNLEMALICDDRGFCWKSVGRSYDSTVLSALPSMLDDAIRSRRLHLRYYSEGNAGFDIDGIDLRSLLYSAGISDESTLASHDDKFPDWLLSISQSHENFVTFSLKGTHSNVLVLPLNLPSCKLYLVCILSEGSSAKSNENSDFSSLITEIKHILLIIDKTASSLGGMPRAEHVGTILSALREAEPGIRIAALHMDDGLVVGSVCVEGTDPDPLAALVSGISHSFQLMNTPNGSGIPEQIYFRSDGGLLLGMSLRKDLFLSVLLEPGTPIGVTQNLIEKAVDQLTKAIASETNIETNTETETILQS